MYVIREVLNCKPGKVRRVINDALVDGVDGKLDVAFAEVRSGNDSTPSRCDGQI